MKKSVLFILAFLISVCFLPACRKPQKDTPGTSAQFTQAKADALSALKQHFQFNAEQGCSLVSAKGVVIEIAPGSLQGVTQMPILGMVDLDFIEIFDRGDMLSTGITTYGHQGNGMKALISGGEFYIEVSQNGQQLYATCRLRVPGALTGGMDTDMEVFTGIFNEQEPEVNGWTLAETDSSLTFESDHYNLLCNTFGWTNIDRFYSDPRPKTTLKAKAPDGYDFENSAMYLTYDGEPHLLAPLDTYVTSEKYFSEHYGQIPIGLACHLIFVTSDGEIWKYAIHPLTITDGFIASFDTDELITADKEQLKQAINALP